MLHLKIQNPQKAKYTKLYNAEITNSMKVISIFFFLITYIEKAEKIKSRPTLIQNNSVFLISKNV